MLVEGCCTFRVFLEVIRVLITMNGSKALGVYEATLLYDIRMVPVTTWNMLSNVMYLPLLAQTDIAEIR